MSIPEARDSALRVRGGWSPFPPEQGTPRSRLAAAFDLYDLGLRMQRERLARENPAWSPAELSRAMEAWSLGTSPPCSGSELRERR